MRLDTCPVIALTRVVDTVRPLHAAHAAGGVAFVSGRPLCFLCVGPVGWVCLLFRGDVSENGRLAALGRRVDRYG